MHQQPYRAGPTQRELERKEIQSMLDKGVIEPANTEWASPIVFVPKPDGTLRFCVDYRRLNEKLYETPITSLEWTSASTH